MSEKEPEYFVKDNVLFCNSIFKKDGEEEKPWDIAEKETVKFFCHLDHIDCGNMAGIKGHCTIRTKSRNDFVVNVPFKVLVKLKYGIEI